MRIISGEFRGRNLLDSSKLKSLRPTTDANREALFNILSSAKFLREIDFDLNDCQIIDICCGSGSVAFEALSRGAKSAILIDNSKAHLELARKNAEILKVEKSCEFLLSDVKNIFVNLRNNQLQSLVFIDPPYEEDYEKIIAQLLQKNWIKKNDLVVIEMDKNNKTEFSSLKFLEKRKYGITIFGFYSTLTTD